MTLITFQSRIHFASDVLEEALRAELEESDHRRVLVICDGGDANQHLLERVQISFPDSVSREILTLGTNQGKEETAHFALGYDAEDHFDTIIACGSARAIAHGRKSRNAMSQSRFAALSKEDRRHSRAQQYLPNFYAIPGVDGLPDPCLSGRTAADHKRTPPNVIICDPSVMARAGHRDIAKAFAATLGRCLATLSESSFNPLADGIAVEGLRRLARILDLVHSDQVDYTTHRELMAASLNGSISQQKGPGLVQSIASALTQLTQTDVDTGSLQRILLPRLLSDLQMIGGTDEALVLRLFDIEEEASLSESVEDMFEPMPLNRSLSDMGFALAEVQQAITKTQDRIHLSGLVMTQIQTIVEDVY